MNSVTLSSSQLTSDWVIPGGKRDPVTGDVDEVYMGIAAFGGITLWYGDKLNALTSGIEEAKVDLTEMNDALANWTLANWNQPGVPKARSDQLVAWGLTSNLDYDYASVNPQGSGAPLTVHYPAIDVSFSYSPTATVPSGYPANQLMRDPSGVLFTNVSSTSNVQVDEATLQPYMNHAPDADTFDKIRADIQFAAESKSQANLSMQIVMTHLQERRGMVFDLTSEFIRMILERKELARNI